MPLKSPQVLYKRLVRQALVGALRSVYTVEYSEDPTLQTMRIATDFALEQQTFPQIIVKFQGDFLQDMGVGHTEEWVDETGITTHQRYRWEGRVTFEIYTLSPLDRDIVFDSLSELIAFGKLDSTLFNFFDYLYGHDFGVDAQIMLNTGQMNDTGEGSMAAPWLAEDALIYTTGMSIECHGNISSVAPTPIFARIEKIIVYPYIFGYEDTPNPDAFEIDWPSNNYEDNEQVTSRGFINSLEP